MVPGLQQFLENRPGMVIKPVMSPGLVIEGIYTYSAVYGDGPEISDSYNLRIEVPQSFPGSSPSVTELDKKIPRKDDYHVNPDMTLCLGSPLRLRWKLAAQPSLPGFDSTCLLPYLYGMSHKLRFGGPLPLGELAHGVQGELEDYRDLFDLDRDEQARRALRLLGMKKRIANKEPCPCDCGRRVGKCPFNETLLKFRKLASRSWFQGIGRGLRG